MAHIQYSPVQETFFSHYPEFSESSQNVLKCLSLVYEKVSRSRLIKCLNRGGFTNQNGKRFITSDINKLLTPIAKIGLVKLDRLGVRCHLEIMELLSNEAVKDKTFEPFAMAIQKEISCKRSWQVQSYYDTYDRGVRDFRIAFYRKRSIEQLDDLLYTIYEQHPDDFEEVHPYYIILMNPFDEEMLMDLPVNRLSHGLHPILSDAFFGLERVDNVVNFVTRYLDENQQFTPALLASYLLHLISRGDMDLAHKVLSVWPESSDQLGYRGWLAFLEGATDKSLLFYEKGLQLKQKETRKKQVAYHNFAGLFHVVALIQSGNSSNLKRAESLIKNILKQNTPILGSAYHDLNYTILLSQGQKKKARILGHSLEYGKHYDYPTLFISFLTLCWQGKKIPRHANDVFHSLLSVAHENGYYWFAKETAALQIRMQADTKKNRTLYKDLTSFCNTPDLCDIIQPKANWEIVLNGLSAFKDIEQNPSSVKQERLVWLIRHFTQDGSCEIVPRLQKLTKKGTWTKGRAVALSTLHNEGSSLPYITVQDKAVISAIEKEYVSRYAYYGHPKSHYFVNQNQALPALIGHPLLFSSDTPTVQLELMKGVPELHVLKKKKGFEISLHPPLDAEESYKLIRENPTRLKYIAIDKDYKKIADIIDSKVMVPAKAKDKVLEALGAVSKVLTIQSDIGGSASENIKKVTADLRPHVHLLPSGNGLQVELLIRPFRDAGSYYKPGSGGKTVMTEIEGEQLQTIRNLIKEKKNIAAIIENCPTLRRLENDDYEYILEDPEECLELLTELQRLKDDIVIAWPKGERFQLMPESSFNNFSMGIKRDRDWFGVTASLQVDDKLILDMKKLLQLTASSRSRFVQLDDGRFLALNRAFKKRLEELRAYSEPHGNGVRFTPLAGLALEEFTQEVASCKTDTHWKKNIKRFHGIQEPQLPSTLQATLRDYQEIGFSWLGRLSAWNVGACLADDMGLGKTVQALASILLRAPNGPTLIICPTSVMMNWEDEAKRFTPTINVLHLADGDRRHKIKSVTSFDMMICSYGLLQSEGELLASVQWQTIVLDEAQAIKNRQTKRSKAAMKLQADFRIITTGTPIENHLGELWNLFRFITPGLLGSHESFKKKFAIPIEKYKDKEASARLKKLIQPFILRRLKQDVLQELPPRTEVTMQVEMSAAETAAYEAQRQLALENLSSEDENKSGSGQQHLRVLAEITKLRQFCCNPNLVVPDLGLASSKLKVFLDTVQELIDNKHKALVFSQFVRHLEILRKHLDDAGISYQYLDGSTPAKQRSKRVKAFQAGKGDLFLISLKAGGSGLNLTAADYVIHMDPWWNPAVEDQASDRAHRIGQQRPVTVYRLVVKNSIEEKIVSLHKTKRALADNLLDGSDMSGKISTDELLALLRGK